jgi:hypothetical protein
VVQEEIDSDFKIIVKEDQSWNFEETHYEATGDEDLEDDDDLVELESEDIDADVDESAPQQDSWWNKVKKTAKSKATDMEGKSDQMHNDFATEEPAVAMISTQNKFNKYEDKLVESLREEISKLRN